MQSPVGTSELTMSSAKRNVLGVLVDATSYSETVERIMAAAASRIGFRVSALAVHGLMTGVLDREHKYRLNHFDMLVPDGQPIRWLLNLRYRAGLRDRVYGPELSLRLCAEAAQSGDGCPIYLYGSSPNIVAELADSLLHRFPGLRVAGYEASQFRAITPDEKRKLVGRIHASGARLVLVGLGCPRQEIFTYDMAKELDLPVVAVGAAFAYLAGFLKEPPEMIQRMGLQWFYRLCQEPRRLWRRYLILNSRFLMLAILQLLRFWKPKPSDTQEPKPRLLPA